MGRHHEIARAADAHCARWAAEFERDLIFARRPGAGRRARREDGTQAEDDADQMKDAIKRRGAGERMRDMAKSFNALAQHDFEARLMTAPNSH